MKVDHLHGQLWSVSKRNGDCWIIYRHLDDADNGDILACGRKAAGRLLLLLEDHEPLQREAICRALSAGLLGCYPEIRPCASVADFDAAYEAMMGGGLDQWTDHCRFLTVVEPAWAAADRHAQITAPAPGTIPTVRISSRQVPDAWL